MKKVLISSLENKKTDQRIEEMRMSSKERWDLAFELIELALAVSPNKQFPAQPPNAINWIELKLKNDPNELKKTTLQK